MKPRLRIAAAVVVIVVVAGLSWLAWRPRGDEAAVLSGYVEGEALYLAAPAAGPVASISVVRGQRVAAGAPLFALDARQVSAQVEQRQAGAAQAQAQVAAAEAGVRRAAAAVRSAEALAADARRVAERYVRMKRDDPGTIATQDLERAEANAASLAAQAEAARAQVRSAETELAAARARVVEAQGGVAEADVRAEQFAPHAPGPARVEEVYLQVGEWAGANQPVVSLLPDDRIKLRFFVPEAVVAHYRIGRTVRFSCDGCGPARDAVIAYVSPRPEFTPPVIYSREARDRLVFLVEARPERPATLTPGLPVDVTPLGPEPGR
jgi:HlyD family secretion protein